MDYITLKKYFEFDLPDYFDKYYDDFVVQYNRNETILSTKELSIIKEQTKVDQECIDTLIELINIINNDDSLHIATMFFIYVTTIRRKPWQNYVHTCNIIKVIGFKEETISLLFIAKQLAYNLIVHNPPYDLNKENLDAFKGYATSFKNEHGYWGISMFNWVMQCAGGCMFSFGILKFCPSYFTYDFPVLFNGKEYVTLAGGIWGIDSNHRLTRKDAIATTVFEENNDEIIANVISRNGDVDFKPTHFDKKIWKDFLRGDYPTIDIHIPSNVEYTPKTTMEAYKKALEFYSKYYPDHKTKAFAGYSWIFAPELKEVLKEDSNILKVQNTMHIMPTLGTYDESCEFIREGSNLYNKIKEARNNNIDFHYGIMYIPVDEVRKRDND